MWYFQIQKYKNFMKSLVWLRNDLRMDDNPALKHACLNSDEVHCLYLYLARSNEIS